ncbi:MAG: polyprenyl synthetase family protein [Bacteroidales bacterium]|jgi:geranylgeranyl pyrophosphate synthase|nr:polyprenyl synthetase family protein [Bacteroidales bacterium]
MNLEKLEQNIEQVLQSDDELISWIFTYLRQTKGKKLRPLLCLNIAEMFGVLNDVCYNLATSIELMHQASLLHDDVIDNAVIRRNYLTVNQKWGNKTAILIGDLILAKAFDLIEKQDVNALKIAIKTVKELSEGVLTEHNGINKALREEEYINTITKKTASLFATAAAFAAIAQHKTSKIVEECYYFGQNIGIVFQIKDDIADRQIDKKNGIITLPQSDFSKVKELSENYILKALIAIYKLTDVDFPKHSEFEELMTKFGKEIGLKYIVKNNPKIPKNIALLLDSLI